MKSEIKFTIPNCEHEAKNISMGSASANGTKYGVTSEYFIVNEKAILPIMGEIHFSRVAKAKWEDEILKMRAGGVNIVSTYLFWIYHEEAENEFDFSGDKDIRSFLEICKENNVKVWLRIGPWAHGECRNGGFPDWLVKKNIPLRRDNTEYLRYVDRYWEKLGEQCKGMMIADGGPVLGIQLENEYGHCYDAPSDVNEGLQHMKTLKKMAIKYGFQAAFYTATAWGGAFVVDGENLPVYGGYVDAPWARDILEQPASENFLFCTFHDDTTIGSDLSKAKEKRIFFDKNQVPYLTAELGGGLQVTAHRRTYPYADDTLAQSLCALGSGANLLGYYMYHGGTHPDGKYSTLQESIATGYYNDLPIKSYDFQTCIRESGEIHESFGKLKRLHLLTDQFGDKLAKSKPFILSDPNSPEEMDTLRASVRFDANDQSGFLFINNHQRKRHMLEKTVDVSLETGENSQNFLIHDIEVAPDECKVIPFGLHFAGTTLKATNASLLTAIGNRIFCYTDNTPYYEFDGQPCDIVTLSIHDADRAYRFGDKLILADCLLFEKKGQIFAVSKRESELVTIYGESGEPEVEYIHFASAKGQVSFKEVDTTDSYREYQVKADYSKDANEWYLITDFGGDKAEIYVDGVLKADWFANGEEWHVALSQIGYPKDMTIRVYKWNPNVYYDLPARHEHVIERMGIVAEQKKLLFK